MLPTEPCPHAGVTQRLLARIVPLHTSKDTRGRTAPVVESEAVAWTKVVDEGGAQLAAYRRGEVEGYCRSVDEPKRQCRCPRGSRLARSLCATVSIGSLSKPPARKERAWKARETCGAKGGAKGAKTAQSKCKTILSQSSSRQATVSAFPVTVPVIVASAVPTRLAKTHASSEAKEQAPSATKTWLQCSAGERDVEERCMDVHVSESVCVCVDV